MTASTGSVNHHDFDGYGWNSHSSPCSQNYINPQLLKLLQVKQPAKLLDLGAGNGALCRLLHRHGLAVVGMEPDPDGVRIAKTQAPSIPFYQLSIESDPSLIINHEGLFDAVVSTEVIEHLYAPHLLPRFAWQCLKPGGLLIVSTPYHGYLKNLAISLAGKWDHHHTALWYGGHIKFWSSATLTRLLVDEGFVAERFLGVGRLPWLWKSMIVVMHKP